MAKEKFNFKRDYHEPNDSNYSFSTAFTEAGKIGATASPQTPNQIGELTSRLNQGLKAVEVGTMNQRLMDQIPAEHFVEMRRLGELTGSKATLHAPIQDLDLAGFTQQGWNDFERREKVEQLKGVIDRAHLLDKDGNIPITVHAGSMPLQKWKKTGTHAWSPEEGGEIKPGQKHLEDQKSEMVMVNQDTGQMQQVKYDEKEYISGKKEAWTPERRMHNLNMTSWDQEQHKLLQLKKDFSEMEDRFAPYEERYNQLLTAEDKKLLTEKEKQELASLQQKKQEVEQYERETYQIIGSEVQEMYSRYKGFSKDPETEQERQQKEQFEQGMKIVQKQQKDIDTIENNVRNMGEKLRKLREQGKDNKDLRDKFNKTLDKLHQQRHDQTDLIVRNFANAPAPETWVSADDFAQEKTSDSIAEAALHAYGEYGEKAPIISMENVYPEFGLSRADSLKATIEESRDKFAKSLMDSKKLSKKKAEEIASKIIGVTWDVGHIYMLKKHGYSDEDIRKEAKTIAPYVKHVHLTDNFGFEDSHLPPGEGSVNIKDQLEEIQKALSEGDLKKLSSIVEAGEFVANFKETPHLYSLSHLNSPLYSDQADPYWRDVWDTPSGQYFTGMGEIMPQRYFSSYGAPGFSQLPSSLGGTGGGSDRGRLASSQDES